MILWPQPDGTIIATPQPAHAVLAGQVMRALADRPEPFEPVCTAAAQHDVAWMPWEAAPEYDAQTGLPRHFNALPGDAHVDLWKAGVHSALANWGRWAALLILRHGSFIYSLGMLSPRVRPSENSSAAMEGYIAWERAYGAQLMAELGVTEAQVAPLSAKIAMVDAIALSLCWGHQNFDCAGAARLTRTAPFAATLEPWPIAAPTLTLTTEALRIPARFDSAQAMQAGLAAAPRETLSFALTPA